MKYKFRKYNEEIDLHTLTSKSKKERELIDALIKAIPVINSKGSIRAYDHSTDAKTITVMVVKEPK